MKRNMTYLYSQKRNPLELLQEVPKSKRSQFILIEDRNHLFRVACQSTVITDHEDLVEELFELGASHVFLAPNYWPEFQALIGPPPIEDFLKDRFFLGVNSQNTSLRKDLDVALRSITSGSIPILIRGESGTGKTRLAREIHQFSNPKGPFVAKNLSEISENLLESEIFGHVKGSFTGALSDKKGLLEIVNGGTLFLDEIATLGPELQAKLLKVIEEKEFSPVGSNKIIKVQFQLISATCEDIEELIKKNRIRQDFYNRICGHNLNMPSLRECPEDIPCLLKSLQKGSSRRLHFTVEAMEEIRSYPWPGNIRELKNWLTKIRCEGQSVIRKGPKGPHKSSPKAIKVSSWGGFSLNGDEGLPGLVQRIEDHYFDLSYQRNRGRPNKICEDLRISKSVFYRLLKNHPSSALEQIS